MRNKAVIGLLAAAGLATTFAALEADHAVRTAWARTWTVQAGELAAFARAATAAKNDFALVDRIAWMVKRDDVAYVLVLVPDGRAKFHGNPSEVGKTYDSEIARRALAAKETITQEVAGGSVLEVDVPLDNGVLRAGFSYGPLAPASRFLLAGAVVCWLCAAAAGLLVLKTS